MGTASSNTKGPEKGLPVNPRVIYADRRSKNDKKPVLIDAPVLVRLQDGTVRYRYEEKQPDLVDRNPRIENPHEGPERKRKHGYFYHSRLSDFGPNASRNKEESWKFCYVYKGAERARQKKLYYVFGKGLKTDENGLIRSSKDDDVPVDESNPVLKPASDCKTHGHLYYDLVFLKHETDEDIDEDDDYADAADIADSTAPDLILTVLEMTGKDKDTLETLQLKISLRTIKPPTHIHIFYDGTELPSSTLLGHLRASNVGSRRIFKVLLKAK